MGDIIEKLIGSEPKPEVMRRATGKVNGDEVELKLEKDVRYFYKWWVNARLSERAFRWKNSCYKTRLFANRRFNKLVKKYGLKEEGGSGG